MSTDKRFMTILMAKVNKILKRHEDPVEQLEYGYEKQKDLLENVKKGMAKVGTSKNLLQARKAELEKDVPKFDNQAKQAMRQGDENLAKAALERKNSTQNQIVSLDEQIKQVNADYEKLVKVSKNLEMKLDELKSTKETVKAQYTAAKASVEIKESISGISDEVGNIGTAMESAKDKTDEMAARSSAIDELTENGVLNNSFGGKEDSIDRELKKAQSAGQVDDEFKKMKRQELLRKNDLEFFKV